MLRASAPFFNSYETPNWGSISILGDAIEAERKRRKLTQGQLADLSDTSINFISQIERGKKTAQIGKVIDVLQILGMQLVIEKGAAGLVNRNE